MSETTPDRAELAVLLDLAGKGVHPLFHHEWIRESFEGGQTTRRYSFARAGKIVEEGLKRLERHGTFARKQDALSGFSAEERREFIQSFFKLVEYKTLDQIKELH